MKKIVIIGGGAAGMSLALELSRSGFEVKVFEKRKKNHHNGLAFLLLHNGFEVLRKMGLEHQIIQKIQPLHIFNNLLSNGKKINSKPMQYLFGAKRHDIVSTIQNQIPPNLIAYEHEFSHFEYDESGQATTVHFANGQSEKGDIFIAADGAHSRIRKSIFPDAELSKTNIREIVSLVEAPELVRKLNGSFVKFNCQAGGRAAGLLPCSKNEVVWFFQFDDRIIHFDKETNDIRSFLTHQLGSWGGPLKDVLIQTDFSKSYLWKTHDLDPLPRYHKNNVGLIGDAAHVFATFTSQGLNTALEDGYDLANLFKNFFKKESTETIFEKFYQLRKKTAESHLNLGRTMKNEFLETSNASNEMMVPIAV